MKITDVIRRAGRSLRQAKARTLLTSLAIGVGAFTITLAIGAGEGGRDYTDQIVRANTAPQEIVAGHEQSFDSSTPREFSETGPVSAGSSFKLLTQEDLDELASLEHVTGVTPTYSVQPTYITTDGAERFVVDSVTSFTSGIALEYAAGSVDGALADDEIVLTEPYAAVLGYEGHESELVGKTVELRVDSISQFGVSEMQKFTVAAVSSQSGLAFRAQGALLVSSDAAKNMYDFINQGTRNYNQFLVAAVYVDDVANVESVRDELVSRGYDAQTASDILGAVNTFINVLMAVLIGFGALAVLTSVFGIINTQYISVLERTQQIGLMKALGARRKDVGRLFRFEAAWIGFLGGAIGAGLAVAAGVIANPIISEALDLGDIYLLIFNPLYVSAVVVGLMLVAVVAGYFPAQKAAKLDPIEALRTE